MRSLDSRTAEPAPCASSAPSSVRVLSVELAGAQLRVLVQGQDGVRARRSGRGLRPQELVRSVRELAAGWSYDAIALAFPGPVVDGRPAAELAQLGEGWLGFDFEGAFGVPTRVAPHAALAALGCYEGGRLLYLGLGSELSTALLSGGRSEACEIAHVPYKRGLSFAEYAGESGLARLGVRRWRKAVLDIAARFAQGLGAEDVVLGGPNARKLGELPAGLRLAPAGCALEGGWRLWEDGARSVPLDPRARVLRRGELPAPPHDPAKQSAGQRAADYVEPGMRVGLGTGSTVVYTLLALAERRLDLRCAATSEATRALARRLGLRVFAPDELGALDLAIDGADEVDPAFNLLKGGGGAHTREKIVAHMARRFIAVVDESKLVEQLGGMPLPLEVLPFAAGVVAGWLRELGAARVTRRALPSDSGHVLLDAHFGRIGEPAALAAQLAGLPGLVGHGLFEGARVERVIVGSAAGARELASARPLAAAPTWRAAPPAAAQPCGEVR